MRMRGGFPPSSGKPQLHLVVDFVDFVDFVGCWMLLFVVRLTRSGVEGRRGCA